MAQGAKGPQATTPARWPFGRSLMPRSVAPNSLCLISASFSLRRTLGRVESPPGKRLAIPDQWRRIGVLAVDGLVELGWIPAVISPAGARARCGLAANVVGIHPVDIVGDSDPRVMPARLKCCWPTPQRCDPGDECSNRDRCGRRHRRDVTDAVTGTPAHRGFASRARGLGSARTRRSRFAHAPGFPLTPPKERCGARPSFTLVQHREVVRHAAQVPPAMPSALYRHRCASRSFAQRLPTAAVARPGRDQRCLRRNRSRLWRRFAGRRPEQAWLTASRYSAQVADRGVSRSWIARHCVTSPGRRRRPFSLSPPPMPCVPADLPTSWRGRRRCSRRRG